MYTSSHADSRNAVDLGTFGFSERGYFGMKSLELVNHSPAGPVSVNGSRIPGGNITFGFFLLPVSNANAARADRSRQGTDKCFYNTQQVKSNPLIYLYAPL